MCYACDSTKTMLLADLPTPRLDRLEKVIEFARDSAASDTGLVQVPIEGNGLIQLAWEQGSWLSTNKWREGSGNTQLTKAPDDWYQWEDEITTLPEGVCGTAACLAGSGVVMFGKVEGMKVILDTFAQPSGIEADGEDDHLNFAEAGRKIFGLTDQEADALFDGDNDLDKIDRIMGRIRAGYYRTGHVTLNANLVTDAPEREPDEWDEEDGVEYDADL